MNENCSLVCHEGKVNYRTSHTWVEFRCIRVIKQECPFRSDKGADMDGNLACKYLHPGDICTNKYSHMTAIGELDKYIGDYMMTDPFDIIDRCDLDKAELDGILDIAKTIADIKRDKRYRGDKLTMKIYNDYEFPEGDYCQICKEADKGRVFEIPHITENTVILHRYHIECYTRALLSPSQSIDDNEANIR